MALSGNEGFGGNNWFAMIILFALIFGWGGFGGVGGNGGYATNEAVQQGFDAQNQIANQREILAAVNAGTAQNVAANNQTFHDLLGAMSNTYTEIQRDIAGLAVGQANQLANQNQCCSSLSAGIAQNRYDAAMNTANVIQAIQADGNATRAMLQENKIETLQAQVQQLQLQNAMQGVVRYPDGWTYNAGASPFCGCGYGNC